MTDPTEVARAAAVPPAGGPLSALLAGADDERGGFEFFQAMRLLEQHFPGSLRPRGMRSGEPRVSVRPHEGLGFPAADVRALEARSGGEPGAQLVVTFLGLYGVDSPLPSYFGNAAFGGANDDGRGVRDFLDIFNNRVYALLYEALRKYRPRWRPRLAAVQMMPSGCCA